MRSLIIAGSLIILSGCSVLDSMVYKIDVPQGNYLEQRDIDQLRVGMSKAQVEYVVGAPVAANPFENDVWYYVFDMNSGSGEGDYNRKVTLTFKDDKLVSYEGDFDRPKNFDTPLDQ
ncbi:outer membrane protein assembly factor BamE [Pseudidiomarina aestuarii]|uniref:Outer membrane protein assembly factor BamE n=1 Tax=Pseudidiomarina aestuarii TaxID=624146 RepID=A0A7Z6ZU76_9GAMM|nr:outer membrane protein assembly factor BamE [Pseudidiomarina aestuarii]RUO41433.1 outer membrane protein assembly factor BamE [Pseudidiomarina aestuarii]